MIIANHVRKHALAAMLGAALLLLGLQILFAYLGELEDIKSGYGYLDALKLILWQAPRYLYDLLPMAALVGSVLGLGMLAQQSELTVMRASGVSLYKVVFWAVQAALVLAISAWFLSQFILPIANAKAKQIKSPQAASRIGELSGYYSKQTFDDGTSTMYYIDQASKLGSISQLKLWRLDTNGRITQVINAASGQYQAQTDDWHMQDVTQITLAQPVSAIDKEITQDNLAIDKSSIAVSDESGRTMLKNIEALKNNVLLNAAQYTAAKKIKFAEKTMQLPIKPELIYSMTRSAEDLSISELYTYTQQMKTQSDASEHRLLFWQKLLAPLAVVSLVLIACSFVFGSLRGHSMGLRLVVALLVGLAFNYLQKLLGFMSIAYQSSPLLFVLIPILISAGIGLYLLERKR